ncbi:MAG: CoA-binding protein [Lewinellaceae bacterium]|nr:CoA-binding protein [Saprospiraceae bacterium]MCB9337407.1 CoA-binding protein [Lewinellaceae bacterium]
MKKTLVIGATPNPARYAYLAIRQLINHGHEVVALGAKEGEIEGVPILQGFPALEGIDTVTLYINPFRQEEYYDYILDLKPRRIIFNPGTENYAFMHRAKLEGVEVLDACTLVMLSTGQY